MTEGKPKRPPERMAYIPPPVVTPCEETPRSREASRRIAPPAGREVPGALYRNDQTGELWHAEDVDRGIDRIMLEMRYGKHPEYEEITFTYNGEPDPAVRIVRLGPQDYRVRTDDETDGLIVSGANAHWEVAGAVLVTLHVQGYPVREAALNTSGWSDEERILDAYRVLAERDETTRPSRITENDE